MAEGYIGEMYKVGGLTVTCTKCEAEVTVPILAGIYRDEENSAMFRIKTDADVADYWSHSWGCANSDN
jgi:hypothetical protein